MKSVPTLTKRASVQAATKVDHKKKKNKDDSAIPTSATCGDKAFVNLVNLWIATNVVTLLTPRIPITEESKGRVTSVYFNRMWDILQQNASFSEGFIMRKPITEKFRLSQHRTYLHCYSLTKKTRKREGLLLDHQNIHKHHPTPAKLGISMYRTNITRNVLKVQQLSFSIY